MQLLEVSDNIKAKYAEQSQKSSVSFLLSGLNLVSTCDTNYKSSKNQRLHVELCLMKMAHLNAAFSFALEGAESKKAKVVAPAPAATKPTGAPAIPSAAMQQPTAGTVPSAAMQGSGAIPSVGLQQPNQQGTVPSHDLQQPHKSQQVTPDAHLSPPEAKAAPAPTIQRPSIPVPPQKKLGKLPSLKDLQNQPAAVADTAVAEEEEETSYGTVVPVDPSRLNTVWHAILRRKKAENMMEYTLLNRQFHIGADNEIVLHLENHVMMDQFTSLRPEILRELKKETGNRSIKLKAEVIEVQEGNKLYTSQDKFNYLAEKYPVLVDMKQRFGLDTDF